MIHIFCALPYEAQPLIQHFKLTELKQFDLFRLYQSEDKEITLTITGIGKLNAASAVSYHHACCNTLNSDVWLNIGIAGHKSLAIGEARLVNKIIDEQTTEAWYPQIIFKPPCQSTELISLDKPCTTYRDALYDMEASAFYQVALRLGTTELIHCLKIVSDNTEKPASNVNADSIKKLIASNTNTIVKVIELLKPLSEEIHMISSEPEHFHDFIEQWHFTQSEKVQLSRLLKQWNVLLNNENVSQAVINAKTGKAVLNTLREKINNTEFALHD